MCADKVTVAKRTIDITAVVSGTPAVYITQSFVVVAPVLKDHRGNEPANELCQFLVHLTYSDKLAPIYLHGWAVPAQPSVR